uniref:RNA-dependent RNA polymerase n=1 Tax=Phasey bean mild yellows virus TaxID=1756832 RepID=A0A8A6LUF1_9VIRU|nr:RNA-dependent RNA polymerase [Phasey bean mild yellows virus]
MNSFFVLSFFFYVFFCVAPVTSGSDLAQPNWALLRAGNSTWPVSQPGWGFTSPCPPCPAAKRSFNFAQSSLDAGPTSQPPTYKGLIQDLWGLALSDVETSFSAVYLSFQDSWVHTADSLSRGFEIAFQRLCWLAIYVWYSVLRVLIVTIARFIMNNYILALAGGSLFVCTALLVKMVRWICGQLPIYLVFTFPFSVGRWIFQRRSWGKFSRNYAEEKCCEQFLSFTINQDPPKKCQLVFQKEDGKHAGYGTCVRLFNGTNGLLTAYHVASNSSKVVSTRTGNKIPLSQFKPLIVSPLYDQVLYVGPTEWESLLGCKGVNFAPAKTLGASKCNIYHIQKDGKWGCTNAEIEGQLKHRDLTKNGTKPTEIRDALPGQLSVLSNTEPGQSGAGYFNGKTLVAIHVGGSLEREDSDATYNVAVPVLPKSGLTSPHYVFETTAPTSGVYDSKIFKALDEAVEQAERWVKMKLSKGETLWADLEDEFPYETETKKTAKAPLSSSSPTETFHDCTEQSGKREARLRPRNNRKDRVKPRKRGLRHPSKRYADWGTDNENVGGENCFQYQPEGGREGLCGSNQSPGPEETEPVISPAAKQERRQQWIAKTSNYRRFFNSQFNWEIHPSEQEEIAGFRFCGKAPQWYHPKQKQEGGWGEEVCRQHPELGEKTHGFGWPQFGAKAELKSLRLQAARWLQRAQSAEVPPLPERERVIKRLVSAYKQAQSINPVATMSGELLWEDFLESFKEAVSSLQLDAGVGVPYIALGKPTHRSLVEDPEMLPVLARLTFDRLEKLSKEEVCRLTPEELVREGLCDPIRVFVKGEPHKQSKLDEGRYRLIMSVSLVDQLVARVLFQEQNKKEIQLWRVVPSKPGFGLSTDGQVLEFTEALAHKVGVTPQDLIENWKQYLVPTDCSGFDWSVADWMLDDDIEVRNRLTKGLTPVTALLRRNWKHCIANSVLCLSDGTLLAQCVPGVQKSGSYNTSSTNSRIRVMCAYHCGATWCCAMGDDALESVDSNLEEYKYLGLKVEVSGKLEFCSHIFESPSLATPVNVGKMLYKLIYGYNPGCENLEVTTNYLAACFSVFNELRHDPELVRVLYEWLVLPVQSQNNT